MSEKTRAELKAIIAKQNETIREQKVAIDGYKFTTEEQASKLEEQRAEYLKTNENMAKKMTYIKVLEEQKDKHEAEIRLLKAERYNAEQARNREIRLAASNAERYRELHDKSVAEFAWMKFEEFVTKLKSAWK